MRLPTYCVSNMPVIWLVCSRCFVFACDGYHRDLHVLTLSFPTRRSSYRVTIAMPALGPSFGVAPSGTCTWMSYLWWKSASRPRLNARERTTDSAALIDRSEEHTSELQSLMRIPYAVF